MNRIFISITYFVEIRNDKVARLAYRRDLGQTAYRPMAVLTRRGKWKISEGSKYAPQKGQLPPAPGKTHL